MLTLCTLPAQPNSDQADQNRVRAVFERERIRTEARQAEKDMKKKQAAEAEALIYRQRNLVQKQLREKLEAVRGGRTGEGESKAGGAWGGVGGTCWRVQ